MRRSFILFLLMAVIGAPAPPAAAQSFVISNFTNLYNALGGSQYRLTNFPSNARITLAAGQTIDIWRNVVIDGGRSNVAFSGGNVARIFHVHPGFTLTLLNAQLVNGASTVGGAIFNEGSLVVSNCVFTGNSATNVSGANGTDGGHNYNGTDGGSAGSAWGGAIFSFGPVAVFTSAFSNNVAKGGNGGNGGNGASYSPFSGDGGNGGNGGGGFGGAIFTSGYSNYIYATAFQNNTCVCGAGGLGGSSPPAAFSGTGGKGGVGANGAGGAILNSTPIRIVACFFQGNGVTAGATAPALDATSCTGNNGQAGGMAQGGALYLGTSANGSYINDTTMLGNFCSGGAGGDTTTDSTTRAGDGGGAYGAGIASLAPFAQVRFCTIATNILVAGTNGAAQNGGDSGNPGVTAGAQIFASPGAIAIAGTILSGGAPYTYVNAAGVGDSGESISSDATAISASTSFANRDPLLLSSHVEVIETITSATNGTVVTNSATYPATNTYIPPVTTNFILITTNTPPVGIQVYNLTSNTTVIPTLYIYDIISNYSYATISPGFTNVTFTTNFLAGNNGGPTPTLAVSNASPAVKRITGIPGIAFPVQDQRLFYRLSPATLGAYDPGAIPALVTNVPAGTNDYTVTENPVVTDTNAPAPFPIATFNNVRSFTNEVTNFVLTYVFHGNLTLTNITEDTNVVFTVRTNSLATNAFTTNYVATNIPLPIISGPHVVGFGQNAVLNANLGTNIPHIAFQWQLNSQNLSDNALYSGTTTSNLALKNITQAAQGQYRVIAGTTLAYTKTSANYFVAVTNLPAVTITRPATGAQTSGDVTVAGAVTQPWTVANVVIYLTNLNDGSVVSNVTDMNNSPYWSATFSPAPGTNVLMAVANDVRGFPSLPVTRRFFALEPRPLTLIYAGTGGGAVTGPNGGAVFDGMSLPIGRIVTLVAHPGGKSLFGNWSVTTNGASEAAGLKSLTISFLMESNTVVTATFVTNIFRTTAGTYSGLFYNTNTDTNADTAGPVGFIGGLALTTNGGYSAKIIAWGWPTNHTITGLFDPASGVATNTVGSGTNLLSLSMLVANGLITGVVSNQDGPAYLLMKPTVKSNFTGAFTLVLGPGFETNVAQGYGYAVMTNTKGSVVISGATADGATFIQSVGVNSDGSVPFYYPLYSFGGVLTGWITSGPPPDSSGLLWIKPAITNALYPAGFTNGLVATNAAWVSPRSGVPPITLPSGGAIIFSNGGLAAPLNFQIHVGTDYRITKADPATPTNYFLGGVNPANGRVKVVFAGDDGTNYTAWGVILQRAGAGGSDAVAGYFLGATNSGTMILVPNH